MSVSAGKPSQQLVDYHAYFYFHELIVLHNAIKDGRLEYVRIFSKCFHSARDTMAYGQGLNICR